MRENFFTHTACINIVGIAVYEEGLDFFHSLKCDEELLNVAVMAELHRVDTMLILNLHSMWGEMMYQYFARHGIEFYLIEDDDAFYYKRNYCMNIYRSYMIAMLILLMNIQENPT